MAGGASSPTGEVAAGKKSMINMDVPLLTHERKRVLLREAAGEQGLVAVGVGPASGRGFQMLHRFAGSCDWLDSAGINVVFVYPAESARHVQDTLSVMAARYRQKPCLLLDETGLFFGRALPARLLCTMRFDRHMTRLDSAKIALHDLDWETALGEFLLRTV